MGEEFAENQLLNDFYMFLCLVLENCSNIAREFLQKPQPKFQNKIKNKINQK